MKNFLIKCNTEKEFDELMRYIRYEHPIFKEPYFVNGYYYGVLNGEVVGVRALFVENQFDVLNELPEEELKPEDMVVGKKYMFWDEDERIAAPLYFLAYTPNAYFPYLVVNDRYNTKYENGLPFHTLVYKNAKRLTK